MSAAVPRLHVVTDDAILQRSDFTSRLRAVLTAGPLALHVRGRETPARRLHALVETAHSLAPEGCVVLVNDRVDIARAARCGAHLPAAGLPISAARRLLAPELPIGRSVHTAAEAARAAADADYVFLGPIWQTPSHPDRPPLGIQALASDTGRIVAIGGVTVERIEPCLAAGAYGVAVVSAVWRARDPGSAARAMVICLERIVGSG